MVNPRTMERGAAHRAPGGNKGSQASRIYRLMEALVRRQMSSCHVTDQQLGNLMKLSLRIIGSRIQPSTTDPLALAERIKKRLVREGQKAHHGHDEAGISLALSFQELFARLMTQKVVLNRGNVLQLLYNLSVFSRHLEAQVEFVGTSIASFQLPLKQNPEETEREEGQEAGASAAGPPGSVSRDAVQGSNKPAFRKPVAYGATEQMLLTDILYAFQGIDGKYVRLNPKLGYYEVSSEVEVPVATRHLVSSLCEMGWLFSKVSSYIKAAVEHSSGGLVVQSFANALQFELTNYYRLLAVLEGQLIKTNTGDKQELEAALSPHALTLRRLVVWTQDPMERLRLTAVLVESVEGLRGGALASCLFLHTQHGDPFRSSFLQALLKKLCVPIFTMIQRWVFEGELEDPQREFFVSADANVTDLEHLWLQKYKLNLDMLPKFITRELANKILLIGKSINFMRQCCSEGEWVMESITAVALQAQSLEFGDISKLDAIVAEAAAITNQRLTEILIKRYKLIDHCLALKRYILLGQGDFIQYLMDLLGPELSKRATQIYRHNLMGVLETAINSSNAKFESADILERIDVKLYTPSPGDEGWDVFALHYRVSSPLNTIIGDQAMKDYLQIFNFLWRLKRVEYSLSLCWRRDMTLVKIVRELPELRQTLRQCYSLRSEMIHFTSNLHNYVMFEVLETSWTKLVGEIKGAQDLDQLIVSHQKYLSHVKEKSFMLEDSKDVFSQLRQIFDSIIRFCKVHELLYSAAMKEVHRRKRSAQEIEERTQKGQWGILNELVQDPDPAFIGGVGKHVLLQCSDIAETYKSQFEQLLQILKKRASSSENLRFLIFRMDFNEHYEQLRRQREEKQQQDSGLPDHSSSSSSSALPPTASS